MVGSAWSTTSAASPPCRPTRPSATSACFTSARCWRRSRRSRAIGPSRRPRVRRVACLDRAWRAGARAPRCAPHPPHAVSANLSARDHGAGERRRVAVADRDRQRAPGATVAPVLRGVDRRRDVAQRRRGAAPPRAKQAQRRRRLHLRRGRGAELRGRVDRHARQLQSAGGRDPPWLPVPLGLSQRHAAQVPRRAGRRHREDARSERGPLLGRQSRSSGPSSTCTS